MLTEGDPNVPRSDYINASIIRVSILVDVLFTSNTLVCVLLCTSIDGLVVFKMWRLTFETIQR